MLDEPIDPKFRVRTTYEDFLNPKGEEDEALLKTGMFPTTDDADDDQEAPEGGRRRVLVHRRKS